MRIAVTGGIAEGKSTVLGMIQQAGLETVSADQVAAEVFARPAVRIAIGELMDLPYDFTREDVRRRLVSNPAARRALNALTHPLIWRALQESDAECIEMPLLIETCLSGHFDRVWVVTCGAEEQLRRLTARLADADAAAELQSLQLATRAKIPFADQVIRTNQPLESVERDVLACLHAEHLL
ncbi:MAG TPA: dephospho-CoA kinase [Fimbriimonadaceae bacterium]|nr:dephospho-CoA kinase [Fimbriimonadaceae bacterium]HRJ32378.1 dephospho-CoA kinase [Fimbriimonadaceae bacterium]